MRVILQIGSAFAALALALAEDHLTPEPGLLADEDEYHAKIRQVFADLYRSDIVLRAVICPAFDVEEIAGIRRKGKELEAFAARPSSQIWDTYLIWQYESGKVPVTDEDGNPVPPEKNQELANLKKRAPSDFREISVHTAAHPISAALAARIERVWQRMLLGARHPEGLTIGADSTSYHFSMWIQGRGIVSGTVSAPDGRKTVALSRLADAIAAYARGSVDEKAVIKILKPLER